MKGGQVRGRDPPPGRCVSVAGRGLPPPMPPASRRPHSRRGSHLTAAPHATPLLPAQCRQGHAGAAPYTAPTAAVASAAALAVSECRPEQVSGGPEPAGVRLLGLLRARQDLRLVPRRVPVGPG